MEQETVVEKRAWPFQQAVKSQTVPWKLPPLILHPFAGESGPDWLLEGSRAQLALHGLIPDLKGDKNTMNRRVLEGRYQEFKMLIYIGRDLQRWAEQCMDFASREPKLRGEGLKEQSFITLLVETPPAGFASKLKLWGITDQRAIFSRASGLNSIFDLPPEIDTVSSKFLNSYHRFADYLFICYQTMAPCEKLDPSRFIFELYASEEYAQLLSDGWRS